MELGRELTSDEQVRFDANRVEHASQKDELRKIAKKVGVDVAELERLSGRLWGRNFISQRDALAGDLSDLAARSAQTKRGHVTRRLIKELVEHRGEGDTSATR